VEWAPPIIAFHFFSCIHRSSTPCQPSPRAPSPDWSLGSGSPTWSSSRLPTSTTGAGHCGGGARIRCQSSMPRSRRTALPPSRSRPPPYPTGCHARRPRQRPCHHRRGGGSPRAPPPTPAVAAGVVLSLPCPRGGQV
jgi:hypothetical protein